MSRGKEEQEKKKLLADINTMKILLILLVDKLGVDKINIAKALGVSTSKLSKLLNPKKYKT